MGHGVRENLLVNGLFHWDFVLIYSRPICSMVLEYLPAFTPTKTSSFVGKYTSTMVRVWVISYVHILHKP